MTIGVPVQVPDHGVMLERPPLAYPAAVRALAGCVVNTARLAWQRRMHLRSQRVGMRLRFADGTSARVFRETVVDREATADPCVLVVEFRLRAVRGRGHAAFRRESLRVRKGPRSLTVRPDDSAAAGRADLASVMEAIQKEN